jgi:hypothetical protein
MPMLMLSNLAHKAALSNLFQTRSMAFHAQLRTVSVGIRVVSSASDTGLQAKAAQPLRAWGPFPKPQFRAECSGTPARGLPVFSL